MADSYRYSSREWVLVAGALLLGLLISGLGLFASFYGVTPPEKLTRTEGVASDVELTHSGGKRGGGRSLLDFRVGGYRVHYSNDLPRFEEVVSAVASERRLQVWVSTERETIRRRNGWVPLYRLVVDDEEILAYQEVANEKRDADRIFFPFAAVFLLGGVWGLYCGVRHRQPNLLFTKDPHAQLVRGTFVLSVIVYSIPISVVLFDDSVHAKLIEAFGARPLGMPLRIVVIAGSTLLCLPVPFFAWHFFRLVAHRFEQGKRLGLGFLLFGRSTDEVHRYSLRVCRVALTYYAMICAAWIAFTVWRGI